MKNEDKRKNKGKLKYIGVAVVVVFLAGIYLVSATTVITDIQMTLEKVGVGNTKIGGGFIEVDDSSGSPIFCVNSTSGNVGIGTADPQGLLQVGEGCFVVTFSGNDVGISDVPSELTPDAKLEITTGTTKDFLMISSTAGADGDRFIVKNDGKVGIGTRNPDEELHVHKCQDAPTMIHVTNGRNSANAKTGVKLDNSEIYVRPGLGGSGFVIHHNVQNAGIIFKIADGEMMRLQSSPSPRKVILGTGVDLWVDGNVCAANSGRQAVASGVTSVDVSFPKPFIPAPPNKIVVLVTPEWDTTVWVSSVTNCDFTVNFGTSPSPGNFFRWFALRTP